MCDGMDLAYFAEEVWQILRYVRFECSVEVVGQRLKSATAEYLQYRNCNFKYLHIVAQHTSCLDLSN